jgi:hypothetical protein
MWICTNKAFLSVVEDRDHSGMMVVRARVAGHITSVFPDVKEECTPKADYLFRAWVPRQQVAGALAAEVMRVDYPNFKNSVEDNDLHDAYSDFWSIMHSLQRKMLSLARVKARGASKSVMARMSHQLKL